MRTLTLRLLLLSSIFLVTCGKDDDSQPTPPPDNTKFTNPLRGGSDPWVTAKDGFYYYSQTSGNRINIWRTAKMSELASATQTTAFVPVNGTPNSANLWAPELHFLDGKWYIYYTAGSGPDGTQRTWVLENSSADPSTGTWVDKGRIFSTDADFWAIDGTVMDYNGERYFIWSGRPDLSQQKQNLYIAKMSNPWTLTGTTGLISEPVLNWEVNGGPVNEGPEYLAHNGKNFLVYSASGCWTDDYALGLLTLKEGGNPVLATDWTKTPQPVFTKNTQGNAYAPGHNAFFKSKDGTEDWIIYHANSNSGDGCGERRTVRIQEFGWNADGTPAFGVPVAASAPVTKPSGE